MKSSVIEDTADFWRRQIPAAMEKVEAGDEPSDLWRHGRQPLTRRRVLQGISVIGGALALSALDAMTGVRVKRAAATVGTEHTVWSGGCSVYQDWAGYNDNTMACVPGPYSYIYCGSDGWFKNGVFNNGNEKYWPIKVCGNPDRNAWRWSYGGNRYRCADGYFQYWRNGAWTSPAFKICSQWVG